MIASLAHMETVLGYTVEELNSILKDKETFYYQFRQLKGIVKGKKKFRVYHPSKKDLRNIHNRLRDKVFAKIILPNHLQGSIKGRGNVTNTKPHKGKLYKFHTDLKSFFDFVRNEMILKALKNEGFSHKVAYLITGLTTYEGYLPQGAPTSPFLANIGGIMMDNDILALCEKNNLTYTRFVDDLTISSQADFQHLVPEIIQIIERNGFFVGYKKTRYKIGRSNSTGVQIGQNGLYPTEKQLDKYHDPLTEAVTKKGMESYFAGIKKANL